MAASQGIFNQDGLARDWVCLPYSVNACEDIKVAHYLCHEQPDLLDFETTVIAARPGAVVLGRSALHPGGGGQVSDAAMLTHAHGAVRITGVAAEGDMLWHLLDEPLELAGNVHVAIDAARRATVAQLHTATHILNALVYQRFAGALVTGAQINADGTARMDFDLPDADNDALRLLARDTARGRNPDSACARKISSCGTPSSSRIRWIIGR